MRGIHKTILQGQELNCFVSFFHFSYTTPKYMCFPRREIKCESSSNFCYVTDVCLVKVMWGKWFNFLVKEISVFTIISGMILKYYSELQIFKIKVT